jgi:hypothetical protein
MPCSRSSVALDPTRLLYRLEAAEVPVVSAGERRP